MKAVFTTPWKRSAPVDGVPPQFDPYKVAVLLSHLRALVPLVDVLFHASEEQAGLSLNLVVELRALDDTTSEIDPGLHALIQATVDSLCASPVELLVYVPVAEAELPPVWYQALLLPYVPLSDGAAWRVWAPLDLPAVFANYTGARDYTERSRTLTQRIATQLIRWYHEGWVPKAGALVRLRRPEDVFATETPAAPLPAPTPVRLRARQDEAAALDTLRMHLWVYPDDVDGLWNQEHSSIAWVWKGTLDPYTGPSKSDTAAVKVLTALPDNYVPLGADRWTSWAVQTAVGQRLALKSWNDVVLCEGIGEGERLRLYAESGRRVPWVAPPAGAAPWPWKTVPGAPEGVVQGTEEYTQAWADTLVDQPPYVVRWVGSVPDSAVEATARAVGVTATLRPDVGHVVHLRVPGPEAVDAWDDAWRRRIRLV